MVFVAKKPIVAWEKFVFVCFIICFVSLTLKPDIFLMTLESFPISSNHSLHWTFSDYSQAGWEASEVCHTSNSFVEVKVKLMHNWRPAARTSQMTCFYKRKVGSYKSEWAKCSLFTTMWTLNAIRRRSWDANSQPKYESKKYIDASWIIKWFFRWHHI